MPNRVWPRTYSSTQLLDICRVSNFDIGGWNVNDYVGEILSLVVVETDAKTLRDKIADVIERVSKVSIGKSLEKLHSVSTIPDEFDGDLDGVDALVYHLSGSVCNNAITALQKVLARFKEYER